ncbi:hypothetical protein AG1IA_05128 [Rhizoctonia solani AG-1 IA]|uniref:Uncharacterized protein n=1 Tax=Thanatephorus cucumeris (strain AG1-IA) TaxID=983506 RepID=L8WS99_THACA|nr:hypothetical protein AG1IA_05128 [Rhizoctonia solani AG-1 IA]
MTSLSTRRIYPTPTHPTSSSPVRHRPGIIMDSAGYDRLPLVDIERQSVWWSRSRRRSSPETYFVERLAPRFNSVGCAAFPQSGHVTAKVVTLFVHLVGLLLMPSGIRSTILSDIFITFKSVPLQSSFDHRRLLVELTHSITILVRMIMTLFSVIVGHVLFMVGHNVLRTGDCHHSPQTRANCLPQVPDITQHRAPPPPPRIHAQIALRALGKAMRSPFRSASVESTRIWGWASCGASKRVDIWYCVVCSRNDMNFVMGLQYQSGSSPTSMMLGVIEPELDPQTVPVNRAPTFRSSSLVPESEPSHPPVLHSGNLRAGMKARPAQRALSTRWAVSSTELKALRSLGSDETRDLPSTRENPSSIDQDWRVVVPVR